MNVPNQITELLKITGRLIGVLEREIEVLRAMQPAEIEALQQDKIALSAAYEAQIRPLASQPELLDAVQPALRTELEKAIEMFRSTLAANERALRAAKDTTQRVLEAARYVLPASGHIERGPEPSATSGVSVRGRPLSGPARSTMLSCWAAGARPSPGGGCCG